VEFVQARIKFKDDDEPNIVSITKQQFHNLSELPIVEECEIIDVVPKPVIDKTKSKEKALIIEDNQAISESFSILLEHLGLNVIGIGSNGMKGLKLYICHNPDITFTDISMPEFDGFYGIKGIKTIDPDAKIVAITAEESIETKKKLEEFGVSQIIQKPFSIKDIQQVLNK